VQGLCKQAPVESGLNKPFRLPKYFWLKSRETRSIIRTGLRLEGSPMQRLTHRFEVRLSRADRAQLQTASSGLGLTPSKFMRMALRERAQLEAVLRKADDKEGGSTE
jgi:hypothetical protein